MISALDWHSPTFWMECVGWISTLTFLVSIVMKNRFNLHLLGLFAAVTTGVYAYAHGATAIWVKWFIAFWFHGYMLIKLKGAQDQVAKEEDHIL